MGLFNYVSKIFSNAFGGFQQTGDSETVTQIQISTPHKRRQDENSPDITSKRRKLDSNILDDFGDISLLSSDSIRMSGNQRHIRHTRANSRRKLENINFSNASNMQTRNSNNYGCDSDDDDNINELANCKVVLQRTETSQCRKTNVINTRQGSILRASKLFSTHMCHRSPLCLDRIHQEQDKATLFEMVKKYAGASAHRRKRLPLTTSTAHNTKQNDQVLIDSYLNKGYFLRQFSSLTNRVPNIEKIDLTQDTVADRTVIDLTNDDDDSQRQVIERDVMNSPEFKNFRSSFTGKDSPVTNPEFITALLKKFEPKQRILDQETKKKMNNMMKDDEEWNKHLVEILEKRLVIKGHVVEEKPTKELAPITDSMLEEIRKILRSSKPTLVQIRDTGIKIQDIYTLRDFGWLNDEVINAYMNLIKNRSESNQEKYPKVHCFNTFFYQQLLNRGYSSVRRWTKKVDVFDHDIIIVPIHLGNHWCLAEVRTEKKVVKYYDSLGSPNNRCLETMLNYLLSEYEDKKGGKFNLHDWKTINVPQTEIPKQKNAYDCGVFACTYAEHITRNAPFNFVQEDMSYFRKKMTYEILTGGLLL